MTTKTQARKDRRAATMHNALGLTMPKKPRNVGVKLTIQALKAQHKAAGGEHFHVGSQTQGHPVNGRFIESELKGAAKRYYVRCLTHDKAGRKDAEVATVAGPFLTHAGAMAARAAM